ncbi:MAG: hypothetical protein ACYCYM_01390 [Saccharofermentanales bacterium]
MNRLCRTISAILCAVLFTTACNGGNDVTSIIGSSMSAISTAESSNSSASAVSSDSADSVESVESDISIASSIFSSSVSSASRSASSSVAPNSSSASISKELTLPTDRTPWKQKEFYLSSFRAAERDKSYEAYKRGLLAHKEAGINLIENAILATTDMYEVLDVCEEIGLNCLAQDISSFSGMGSNYPLNNDDMMLDFILTLSQYKSLIGYYLWDEPGLKEFTKLKYVYDFFKDKDPGRLAYSIILPSYGVYAWGADHNSWQDDPYKKYVDSYIATVDPDVMCVDYYPFSSGDLASISESYLWRDLGYLRAKALETKKPLWFYFQAINMKTPSAPLPAEKLKVQMYSALAYGTTGLIYYTSLGVITDADGNKLPGFSQIKSLNSEVLNLGRFLFTKKSSKLYHTGVSENKLPGYFVDDLAASDLIGSAPDDAIIGVFTDNTAAKYLVIVNKNFKESMNFDLTLKSEKKVKEFNKKTNESTQISASTDSIHLQIAAGDCAIYIIE